MAGVKLKNVKNQLEFFEIPSPCIGVCEVNSKGFCKGCFRSRDERLYWLELSTEQRRQVVRLCQSRKARVLRARQEAAAQRERDTTGDDPVQSGLF